MKSQAKQQRPQAQTVDELFENLHQLAIHLQQAKRPTTVQALQAQIVEIRTELHKRQRRRNQQDHATGRDREEMTTTVLPPTVIQSDTAGVDLGAVR